MKKIDLIVFLKYSCALLVTFLNRTITEISQDMFSLSHLVSDIKGHTNQFQPGPVILHEKYLLKTYVQGLYIIYV